MYRVKSMYGYLIKKSYKEYFFTDTSLYIFLIGQQASLIRLYKIIILFIFTLGWSTFILCQVEGFLAN